MKLLISYTTSNQITEDSFTKIVYRKIYAASTSVESAVIDFMTKYRLTNVNDAISQIQLSICEEE